MPSEEKIVRSVSIFVFVFVPEPGFATQTRPHISDIQGFGIEGKNFQIDAVKDLFKAGLCLKKSLLLFDSFYLTKSTDNIVLLYHIE